MYVKRTIEEKLVQLMGHFPAVALLGPRQVGKTTLVKEIQKAIPRDSIYLDLENPVDAGTLAHPVEFFQAVAGKTVIIDEIQRKPDLFPVLRSAIDKDRIPGRFLLLGSASPQLLFMSNETLAGRIVYLELSPFVYSEIKHLTGFRNHWLKGGFPESFLSNNEAIRKEWLKSFISAYVERDLRLLGLGTSPYEIQRILYMLTGFQGNLLNFSSLSNSMGISSPTTKNIVSYFERSFLIRLLNPWYSNIGKRLVKSQKFYFRDSGILNFLKGISSYEELLRNPMLGSLWEGYVIEEIINTLGDEFQYYFYRTADGTECDLLIFRGNECLVALDAKFSPTAQRTKSMTITLQDLKPRKSMFVVPECPVPYQIGDNQWVTTPWDLIEMVRVI